MAKRGEYLKVKPDDKKRLRRLMFEAEVVSTQAGKRNSVFLRNVNTTFGSEVAKQVTTDKIQKWHKKWAADPSYQTEISERRATGSGIAAGAHQRKLSEQEHWVGGEEGQRWERVDGLTGNLEQRLATWPTRRQPSTR